MDVDDSDDVKYEMTILKNDMINHLTLNDNIVFKSQQRGEPDLSRDEKRLIAEDCLLTSPLTFLSRFGKFLLEHHLPYFKSLPGGNEYEINYYVQEVQKELSKSKITIKNRRLEALKRLAVEGDYFSEGEMRKRNPLLYDQLVGQFLTQDEKKEKDSFGGVKDGEGSYILSSLLLEQLERDQANDLLKKQEEAEDNAMEEEEEDEDDDKEKEDNANHCSTESNVKDDRILYLWGESDTNNVINCDNSITSNEKKLLKEEFRSHMYRAFLSGKEQDFDYSQVDTNVEYDDLDEVERDEQERYFDSESPEAEVNTEAMHTDAASRATPDEDPLDNFMKEVQDECLTETLNQQMKSLLK